MLSCDILIDASYRDSKANQISLAVLSNFGTLTMERALPQDTILSTFTMAVAAMWSNQHYALRPDRQFPSSLENQQTAESLILAHTISLVRVLMEVGSAQINEALKSSGREGTAGNLAGLITASFRRTLPTLRIASGWLKHHINRLVQQSRDIAPDSAEVDEPNTVLSTFWSSYVTFASDLRRVFPLEQLPTEDTVLDEDIELQGFLPLKNQALETNSIGLVKRVDSSMVHPNEEHLMRLRDIQKDAAELASLEVRIPYIVFHIKQLM